jgi:hypothetical protein
MGMGLSLPGGPGGTGEPDPIITPLGSFSIDGGSPARVATDSIGTVYVSNPDTKKVLVYANNGVLLKTIGSVQSPLGIAVNADGQLFISDTSDNYVGIFTADGALITKLGQGDDEFGLPNDIAVTDTRIYVTDSINNAVVSYDISQPDNAGIPFGSGLLDFPTGIAVDATKGEIFVIDHGNRFIRIFDLDGNYLKGIDIYLTHLRPLGITVCDGKMYITDAYHSMVSVYEYDGATDTYVYVKKFGIYGDGVGELQTPTDGADDKDHKLFVANTNNQRIEVFGLGSFTGLQVMPNTITVSGYSNGSSVTQSVEITSTGDETDWTVSESSSWISLSATSGSTPSTIDVTVNPAVSAGSYTAEVRFATPSGTESVLLIHLDVESNSVTLNVVPEDLNLVYQKGAAVLPSGELSVSSSGSSVDWHASISSDWLTLGTTSGVTPDTITVLANSRIRGFSAGSYDAEVTVDSDTADGAPVIVAVRLEVIEAANITVTTNLSEAAFTITGPENFAGTGTAWSVENVPPGTYTVAFDDVDGYIKPANRTFTLNSGQHEIIDGTYREKPVATHIIAGSGHNKGNLLNVLSLDGILELSIVPFEEATAVKVDSGDMDGDGIDEIIAANGKDTIKVYNADGIELAFHSLTYTVSTVVSSGRAVDSVSGGTESVTATRSVESSSLSQKQTFSSQRQSNMQTAGVQASGSSASSTDTDDGTRASEVLGYNPSGNYRYHPLFSASRSFSVPSQRSANPLPGKTQPVPNGNGTSKYDADMLEITVTDYDNDGKAEIIAGYIFSKLNITEIAAFGLVGQSLALEGVLSSSNATEPFTIASGDIDGNGASDLLVATDALLSAYAMNSGLGGISLLWTQTLAEKAPPSMATGYINDDSSAEICYGAGPASTAESRVTCLNGDGTAYGLEITAFGDLGYKYGATVAVGDIDADGGAEIGIGAGPGPGNEALIRLYANDGGYIDTITTMNSYYGVNISFGSFGN